jgi:hypothetical protein
MKSKIQIVIVMTVAVMIGASGTPANGSENQRINKRQPPIISTPQDIGPVCPPGTSCFGASGNSWGGQQEFGKHRSGTDRLPMDVPHDIIGPACPGTNPCVK